MIEGTCNLNFEGENRILSAGDAVVFPAGNRHWLADKIDSYRHPGKEVVKNIQDGRHREIADRDVATRLLCGHFEFDRAVGHPLITELPQLVLTKNLMRDHPTWIETIAPILAAETQSLQPGADTVVDRLAEVLLIQVLRNHLMSLKQAKGFLAATMDQRVNRALKRIHAETDASVDLATLAHDAGMSRSSFSQHFKELMGQSPITYLTSWRLMKARDWLHHGNSPIAEIADRAGYASEAAFSRAFKRQFSENPSACRG